MKLYIVKIASQQVVDEVLAGKEFVHDGIYNFEAQLQVGDPVIIYFGGDKAQISWDQGIRGVGKVTVAPFDKGYDRSKPKNFKIKIMPADVLEASIPPKVARTHPRLAADIYEIPYIGANHFPTQAISSYDDPIGIKALAELYNEYSRYNFGQLTSDDTLFNQNANILSLADFLEVASSLQAKPFLILTGLSGSGKTLQALSFAKWITPEAGTRDAFSPGAAIQSSNKVYYVRQSDRHSVEFWNSEDADSAVKVTLPREMIKEWVEYIQRENISETTSAREIREEVKKESRFSDQLHSFETHLKASAFAFIRHGDSVNKAQNYELISVGADWTSNENLLGYPDALNSKSYRKPDNGALDLILRAKDDPENPYFLILDEMNLSHVERYFADFLSAMESGEAISLHDGDENDLWDGVPGKLKIPKNLFVIGTVNVDETTYMFSPKVLDRANVIEFRVTAGEMKDFLANPQKPNLEDLAGKGAQYAKAFVAAAKEKEFELDEQEDVSKVLMRFFPALQEAGAEFGYRTAHEICRFVYFHKSLSDENWKLDGAMDAAIMQKLLPKLHGSKKKLGPVLEKLVGLCPAGQYPTSAAKIARMQQRLTEHGFTSFAEA